MTWNSAMASRLKRGWPKPTAGHLLRDLLPVEVQLERAIAHAGVVVDGVGGDALHLHGQLHPVAALQRQFLHLAAIDVAGHLRGADVDERRLAGHGERLAERGDLHRERHGAVLPDEHLHVGHDDGRKARELGLHLVPAGRDSTQPVVAALVADAREHAAVLERGGRHGRPGQCALRVVGDGADDGCLLGKDRSGRQHEGCGPEADRTHAHNAPFPCGESHEQLLERRIHGSGAAGSGHKRAGNWRGL